MTGWRIARDLAWAKRSCCSRWRLSPCPCSGGSAWDRCSAISSPGKRRDCRRRACRADRAGRGARNADCRSPAGGARRGPVHAMGRTVDGAGRLHGRGCCCRNRDFAIGCKPISNRSAASCPACSSSASACRSTSRWRWPANGRWLRRAAPIPLDGVEAAEGCAATSSSPSPPRSSPPARCQNRRPNRQRRAHQPPLRPACAAATPSSGSARP